MGTNLPIEACINCHFFSKIYREGKFTVRQTEREAARNSDFSWAKNNAFALACYCGIWDEGIDPNLISMRSDTVSKERKSECFFYPHSPGMTFMAAKNLWERQNAISPINTDTYIAGDQFNQTGDFREANIKSNLFEANQPISPNVDEDSSYFRVLIILVLEFAAALAGNLLAGWIQQDIWSNVFTPVRIIATVVSGILMLLVIVWLETTRTEDHKLLQVFSYGSRSKSSLNEETTTHKYEAIAKERVRNSFVTLKLWNCNWTWYWSNDLEPLNIQGHCTGRRGILKYINTRFYCDYPVRGAIVKHSGEPIPGINDVGIICTRGKSRYHEKLRAIFQDVRISGMASDDEINTFVDEKIRGAIINKRNLLIAKEIKKLRLQPWR